MAAKATGKVPEMLRDQPELPPEFSQLVGIVRRFPQPMDWASFEAWSRMSRRKFARWEIDVLAHIDLRR